MRKIIVTIKNIKEIDLYQNADVYVVANKDYAIKYPASFSTCEINEAASYIHSIGKEIYLSINKVFLNEEIFALENFLNKINHTIIDGYLVADLGAFYLLKKMGLKDKVIYSPETLIVNYFDMNYCFDLGMKSVVLSKEMTLNDIRTCISKAKSDVIIYSFGYYHMFYSRRKLIKNYFDQINEDNKHQNEHLLLKELTRNNMYHIFQDENGTIICNSDIFTNIDYLNQLDGDYFIDSYDLDESYVKQIIDIYSNKIKNGNGSVKDLEKIDSSKTFTTGFLFRKIGVR